MKFDVTKVLTNIEGEGLKRATGKKDKDGKPILVPMQAKHAIVDALLAEDQQGQERTSGMKKLLRHKLAERVYGASKDKPFSCTAEEATEIKDCCDRAWGALIYAQVVELVEGAK